ncbi:MAG TPA: D-aminoacyl-tRNA deacylase [Bacillota bacterium]|nr:D-aminoacyl-tRNA deacylase [Bacillota bacterium]HPF42708.1 D-aminoacyl-tRNA deacylase [Bacillota bacterium]HPJ86310.1 D-aminoacyl-tRNA deacylase [Bacillota bacterium]HPQ62333.1 D-aminoacyl-tRNA deacylase [Bacillota bacterium]HRX92087.1 D-aminoacyl-tRNA deacylase [Candidatus Izemoplasmatales bacterium]
MKVVVQRVAKAGVSVEGKNISSIGKGYLLLVGIGSNDTETEIEYVAGKIAKLRIFPDDNDKMNKSVIDISGDILAVSQFTLYGDISDGNRPSFTKAMEPVKAQAYFDQFVSRLSALIGKEVKKGVFGAHMEVELTNDGPVTIIYER